MRWLLRATPWTAQASEKTMEVERLTAEKLTLEDMLRTVQADRADEANDADADTSDTPTAAPPLRAVDASKAPALGRCLLLAMAWGTPNRCSGWRTP